MTPETIQFLPAEPVMSAIADLKTLLEKLTEPTSATAPAFLPMTKLARHFGISRSLAIRYVAAAISAGRLEVLSPEINGTKGNHLYSVHDFKIFLDNKK